MRIIALKSRHPFVALLVVAMMLALLIALLTAGIAIAALGAVVGGAGFALRRLLGGRSLPRGSSTPGATFRPTGQEVFPPAPPPRPAALEDRRALPIPRDAAPRSVDTDG